MAFWESPKPSHGILKVKSMFIITLRLFLSHSVNMGTDGTKAVMSKTAAGA